jgi:hypothetical protein
MHFTGSRIFVFIFNDYGERGRKRMTLYHAMHVFPLTHTRRKTFRKSAYVTCAAAKLNPALISRSTIVFKYEMWCVDNYEHKYVYK